VGAKGNMVALEFAGILEIQGNFISILHYDFQRFKDRSLFAGISIRKEKNRIKKKTISRSGSFWKTSQIYFFFDEPL
jgi:hypothetical protein